MSDYKLIKKWLPESFTNSEYDKVNHGVLWVRGSDLESELVRLQEGMDSYYPTHIELDKRIRTQLDLVSSCLEKQISEGL